VKSSRLVSVEVDSSEIRTMMLDKISDAIKEADVDLVFWDSKELMRRTCMSWNFIQEHFFFDPHFPKHKVGTKWLIPAKEARQFLERWIREQPTG